MYANSNHITRHLGENLYCFEQPTFHIYPLLNTSNKKLKKNSIINAKVFPTTLKNYFITPQAQSVVVATDLEFHQTIVSDLYGPGPSS